MPNKLPADMGLVTGNVELMEFGDFTCTRCRQSRELIHTVLRQFEGQLTYTYRHFPARRNEAAILASLAGEAARRQGQFWPMYQALFTQPTINRTTVSMLAIHPGLN